MQDRLELCARRGILEHEAAHRRAVEGAGGVGETLAERLEQSRHRLAARGGERARQLVGIDHRRAEGREPRGDRALARSDAAGEADRDHAGKRPSQAMTASRPHTRPAMPPSAR